MGWPEALAITSTIICVSTIVRSVINLAKFKLWLEASAYPPHEVDEGGE